MSDFFNAFEMGPVTERGLKAVAPEVFRGIYAMPVFVTVPTSDLAASTDFWVRGFGFVELFSVPGQVAHLRRWAFQDVLLVPAAGAVAPEVPAMSVSFLCVLSEIDPFVEACSDLVPGSVAGPRESSPRNRRRRGTMASLVERERDLREGVTVGVAAELAGGDRPHASSLGRDRLGVAVRALHRRLSRSGCDSGQPGSERALGEASTSVPVLTGSTRRQPPGSDASNAESRWVC